MRRPGWMTPLLVALAVGVVLASAGVAVWRSAAPPCSRRGWPARPGRHGQDVHGFAGRGTGPGDDPGAVGHDRARKRGRRPQLMGLPPDPCPQAGESVRAGLGVQGPIRSALRRLHNEDRQLRRLRTGRGGQQAAVVGHRVLLAQAQPPGLAAARTWLGPAVPVQGLSAHLGDRLRQSCVPASMDRECHR